MNTGCRIEVRGTVQGVGFRPWVYRLAQETGVGGRVRNHSLGVTIEAFGGMRALDEFVNRLRVQAPPPALVRGLELSAIPPESVDSFVIQPSAHGSDRVVSIPPDLATCPDCEHEVLDSGDRRHHYPFTNCTSCGPRFTIATDVPYDRRATTMGPFEMCKLCQREYDSVADRRFHAQPNACPVCGPRLELLTDEGLPISTSDPLITAAARLVSGQIVAIKGLGGFHLACDATRPDVVKELRLRKHRDEKPFAVMVRDLAMARTLAEMSPEEELLLRSPERPIVLVKAHERTGLAPEVAPGSRMLGLFLPYTPLHHLLLEAVDSPLVMTSANLAEEPICIGNDEAFRRLKQIADALLIHDRDIVTRCDDSVARVIAGKPTVLRRSRGYVPRAIELSRPLRAPVLACGAHLKNTFCLADRSHAYLGPHIGDLENLEALDFFESAVARMERFLRIRPEVVAHDLHPGYLSTQYAESRDESLKVAVQHHHAHVVSAMAEHGLEGPVIGVAYDGTGYGTDGTAWGGEVLLTELDRFERLATFRPIPLAGGDTAIREPWRIAVALLADAYEGEPPVGTDLWFPDIAEKRLRVVQQMIERGINTPRARGVGRYFDGIGALVLGKATSSYEGQVAVAWNLVADSQERGLYDFGFDTGAPDEIDLRPLVRGVVADICARVPASVISARFHNTLIEATVRLVENAASAVGRLPVVLTGGVFQNPILAEGVSHRLAERFDVRLHSKVPPGDGGIALGQALVADAIARKRM